MPERLRVITFDLEPASLASVQEALPEWEIEQVKGATAGSLTHHWNPWGGGPPRRKGRRRRSRDIRAVPVSGLLQRFFNGLPRKRGANHGTAREPTEPSATGERSTSPPRS